MKTSVELFCGTKSFSKVAARLGYSTFTVDIDQRHSPDLIADVADIGIADLPLSPTFLWASPPCQCFSTLAIWRYWNKDGTPKPEVYEAIALVAKTMALIRQTTPTWWFIENPRGMLRTIQSFEREVLAAGGTRRTVTYCQYGDTRMKPTDIWTNAHWWKPRNPCKAGSPCHEPGGFGNYKTGTIGLKNAVERARIPAPLFNDIFSQHRRWIEKSAPDGMPAFPHLIEGERNASID